MVTQTKSIEVKVTFEDNNHLFSTFNGSYDDAIAHYVGNNFSFAHYENENYSEKYVRATKVELMDNTKIVEHISELNLLVANGFKDTPEGFIFHMENKNVAVTIIFCGQTINWECYLLFGDNGHSRYKYLTQENIDTTPNIDKEYLENILRGCAKIAVNYPNYYTFDCTSKDAIALKNLLVSLLSTIN